MIGRTIGHYEVVAKLGEGGMGAVFKAKDTHLDRFVALKVLPHDKMSDAERKRRFTQEAKAASALNHPNIITIYDISSSDGVDYIAMEFVEGRTLEAVIAAGPLKVSDALKYARQMADALAAAHAAGILHRDLKPANVMVRESGLVKVLDFGLAKLTDDGSDSGPTDTTRTMSSTRAGQILGTVAYMSPEQAEGKKVDFRSDIFSFGVVLYEMASGVRAFPGDSQASVLAAVLRDDPRPVTETRSDMPVELDQLISRCLRKDPARRVQTMADLKAALEDLPELITKSSMSTISSRNVVVPPPILTPATVSAPPPVPSVISSGAPPPALPPPALSQPSYSQPAFAQPAFPQPALPPPSYPAPPPAALEPRKKRSRRARWWIVFGLIFIVPSLFREMRSLLREELPAPPVPSEVFFLKSAPLTGNAGTERMPSFSPDGKQIVYSWDGPKADTFNLYVKRLGDDPSVRLTTNVHEDYAPAWSPDGATIAFLRSSRFSDDVLLIPASGGAERKIGEVAHIEGRYGLAWKKDSQHLIVSDAPSPGTPASLYELSIATAEKKRITKPSRKEEGDFFPSVSPEGNFLAFVRDPGSYRAELFTLDLTDEDADPQRIAAPRMEVTHPVWKPDGTQLIYGSGAGPVKLLWRVQADGSGKPMPLIGLSNGGEPAVSARGDRMVYSGTSKGNKTRSLFLVEEFR